MKKFLFSFLGGRGLGPAKTFRSETVQKIVCSSSGLV